MQNGERNNNWTETGTEFELKDALFHTAQRFLKPDIKDKVKDGDTITHLAKVGADFCTGMGKLQQKKEGDYDEDGSHNTGLQTLKLSLPDKTIFENKAPGGSELLKLIGKSTHKDTEERMVQQMKNFDTLADEIPEQVVDVDGDRQVRVQHHLVNLCTMERKGASWCSTSSLNLSKKVRVKS